MDDHAWDTASQLAAWLDANNQRSAETNTLLRLLKLSEEVGEAAQAAAGILGSNPRKGHTHTRQDLHAELCDVILTAMVALTSLTPDARKIFVHHLDHIATRSLT